MCCQGQGLSLSQPTSARRDKQEGRHLPGPVCLCCCWTLRFIRRRGRLAPSLCPHAVSLSRAPLSSRFSVSCPSSSPPFAFALALTRSDVCPRTLHPRLSLFPLRQLLLNTPLPPRLLLQCPLRIPRQRTICASLPFLPSQLPVRPHALPTPQQSSGRGGVGNIRRKSKDSVPPTSPTSTTVPSDQENTNVVRGREPSVDPDRVSPLPPSISLSRNTSHRPPPPRYAQPAAAVSAISSPALAPARSPRCPPASSSPKPHLS